MPARRGDGAWLVPLALATSIAPLPQPARLALHAWRYCAIFADVIAGLTVEPLPGGPIGLIDLAVVTLHASEQTALVAPLDAGCSRT